VGANGIAAIGERVGESDNRSAWGRGLQHQIIERLWRSVATATVASWCFGVGGAQAAVEPPQSASSSNARLRDDSQSGDWAAFGRTYSEQHFSPLRDIGRDNIARLGLAWSLELGPGNSVTAPLEVDGTLYFATGYSLVHAVDVRSGKEKWAYDPKAAQAAGRKLRQGWGSRGLAWWNGKIYTGTQDGRLIALDAGTGQPVWSVMTVNKDDYRFISGAPRAFAGKVIVGHGGADAGDTRGYVTAYDAETGKQLWRFFTVPGNPADGFENDAMRMAAQTWNGEWWKFGGGGTVWNAITYDQDLDQVYLGTGNGAPWNYQIRSQGKGDNLFLSSVVALDAKTGAYRWHYQTNPGEAWDYNASMDMELADLQIHGKAHKVLMTAPKNGFFYVIDRRNGHLISAEPYVKVTWATSIDLKTGRPHEVAGIRYEAGKPFLMAPSTMGAHTWLPMAFSPVTGLEYIPAIELSVTFDQKGIETAHWHRTPNNVLDEGVSAAFPLDEKGDSALVAWNPVTQEQAWRVKTPGYWNGGVLATAGDLVFQGHIDGTFNAYAAQSGELVWKYDAQAPVLAPPISYSVNGQQYITVLTGMGTSGAYLGPLLERFDLNPLTQSRRVLTFTLGGRAELPADTRARIEIPADPQFTDQPEAQARGVNIFGQRCSVCHGFRAVAVGAAPDLRASAIPRATDAFFRVLHDGALVAGGMPQFDELSPSDLDDVRQYIRYEAQKARAKQPDPSRQ
jgi:quinohemoprotein ethanol dehydrogenase